MREANRRLEPANPVYEEVLRRVLSSWSQRELEDMRQLSDAPAYLSNGKLNMRRLLEDFQNFWRANSESWIERYRYKEAAPHLILHAFLYRIVNGGRITILLSIRAMIYQAYSASERTRVFLRVRFWARSWRFSSDLRAVLQVTCRLP